MCLVMPATESNSQESSSGWSVVLQAVNQLMIDDWRDENYETWDDSDSGDWADDGLVMSESPIAASAEENIDIKGDSLASSLLCHAICPCRTAILRQLCQSGQLHQSSSPGEGSSEGT